MAIQNRFASVKANCVGLLKKLIQEHEDCGKVVVLGSKSEHSATFAHYAPSAIILLTEWIDTSRL